jgi:hypothetical protein
MADKDLFKKIRDKAWLTISLALASSGREFPKTQNSKKITIAYSSLSDKERNYNLNIKGPDSLDHREGNIKKRHIYTSNPSRVAFLEKTVKKLTPQYMDVNNPSFNPKLMQAHYLLALQHKKDGDNSLAEQHFKEANHELNAGLLKEKQKRDNTYFLPSKGTNSFRAQDERLKQLEFYEKKVNAVANEIYSNDLVGFLTATCRLTMFELKPKSDISSKINNFYLSSDDKK